MGRNDGSFFKPSSCALFRTATSEQPITSAMSPDVNVG